MTNTERKQHVLDWFSYFHEHPEISWQETDTTQVIRDMLQAYGCRTQTFTNHTGVIGELGEGHPVVALRADIDALWQDVGGRECANHSCGHDGHMAMVLGVVDRLSQQASQLPGTVRFIFQPAEEKGQGARTLVKAGMVDDVDVLYGVHLRPQQEVADGDAAPSISHGAARLISGEIIGEDAHGARLHLGMNAIEIGSAIVAHMQQIHIDPMVPHSIKMTSFHAGGESANIIPGHATFQIDIRAQTNEVMAQLTTALDRLTTQIADMYGVKITLQTEADIAGAVVHQAAEQYMRETICDVLGPEHLHESLVTPGGDDFHFYTLERPHLKATMLGLGCGLQPGLHHPEMTFNHEALETGTDILLQVLQRTMTS